MTTYLGVDGGGSKTAFVLLDSDGRILGRTEQASSYYFEHGLDHLHHVLADGLAALSADSGIAVGAINYSFFALPGYGEVSRDTPHLDALPAQLLGHRRYRCDNDMVAGWAGSLGGDDGINVVAGTGSMTYGERAGARNRVGGWGELFGDEGSGYWIGIAALNAFTRMSDGRLAPGPLHTEVKQALALDTDLDLLDVVFTQWNKGRGSIATLAPIVVAAAIAGDMVASDILSQAARHLADLVDATRNNLAFQPGEQVPVSYSGGVFSAALIRDSFAARLNEQSSDYDFRRPLFPPAVGAALYAAKLAGDPLTASALQRLAE